VFETRAVLVALASRGRRGTTRALLIALLFHQRFHERTALTASPRTQAAVDADVHATIPIVLQRIRIQVAANFYP